MSSWNEAKIRCRCSSVLVEQTDSPFSQCLNRWQETFTTGCLANARLKTHASSVILIDFSCTMSWIALDHTPAVLHPFKRRWALSFRLSLDDWVAVSTKLNSLVNGGLHNVILLLWNWYRSTIRPKKLICFGVLSTSSIGIFEQLLFWSSFTHSKASPLSTGLHREKLPWFCKIGAILGQDWR